MSNENVSPVCSSKPVLLAALSANPMTPPQAKEMIKRKLRQSLFTGSGDLLSPEDLCDIRNRSALWTDAIRTCDPSVFESRALQKDANDLLCDVMIPVPGYRGFQDQFDMMERMRTLQRKKQGVHTLSTPYIVPLSKDTAAAYFLDLGWTMMGEAFGNAGEMCPAMPDIGRYIMKLRKCKDGWKLFELNWGPVIQYGMWQFDRSSSTGWAGKENSDPWPHYC